VSKDKGKAKEISKGSAVRITSGDHMDKVGKVLHLRALTGEAHVELESGAVVNVPFAALAAA